VRLFVPAETREGERRVALVPDTVPKLVALGLEVCVESGAGVEAYASDEDYLKAGANVIATADVPNVLAEADVIATVRPMDPPAAATLKDGAVVLSFLQPRPRRCPSTWFRESRGRSRWTP